MAFTQFDTAQFDIDPFDYFVNNDDYVKYKRYTIKERKIKKQLTLDVKYKVKHESSSSIELSSSVKFANSFNFVFNSNIKFESSCRVDLEYYKIYLAYLDLLNKL